ncbi:MAG: DUF3015 domain-containing protein [Bdellovibrionales bacterium]|nr:DUF3015 domain-containing protein [Bdellovibrionales bacterium]
MKLFLLVFGIILGSHAQAADGSSGCGPGWFLFKENSLVSSALRATTNSFLFPVTTIGMTVGTSNCTQHKLVLKEQESLHFVAMNHYELKNAIVKGHGEYLSAFASTMGCPMTAQGKLNQSLRSSYQNIYPSNGAKPEGILLEVYKTILSDPELTQQCSLSQTA